jgi:hypothetical protein
MKLLRLFPLIFFFNDACVDPLDVPVLSAPPVLVVDGMITDEQGPYTVRLSLNSPLDQDLDRRIPVTNAIVKIGDDNGAVEVLTESISGTYETDKDGIRGTPGRKYQLLIITTDGKQYASPFTELTPPGEVEDVYFRFMRNSINKNDLSLPQDAFEIFINAKGRENFSNLLRWRWKGVYQVHTFPELREMFIGLGSVPDPLPCSGYEVVEGTLTQLRQCECCDCWVTKYSNMALISDNNFINDVDFNAVQVAKLPVDKRLFYDKYYIEVEQLSLPEEVYHFWKLVSAQQEGAQSIFQPNIVKIKGNIKAITDPDEEVFGVFAVSSVARKGIFITRADIPGVLPPVDTIRADCRATFPGSTNQKPPFW